MNATLTLTEEQLEIMLQALNARDCQLRYRTAPGDARRSALPIIEGIHRRAADALTAIYAARRNAA
jgi:hypothetical protein